MATTLLRRRATAPAAFSRLHSRSFSSSLPAAKPVPLAVDRHPAPSSSSKPPLVILHGLYGSKQNWRSLAKRLAQRIESDVYALDLRNHGESPSTPGETSYADYASDVHRFIQDEGFDSLHLIGHSMGGKVALSLALIHQPSYLSSLVSVDMAPSKGPVSKDFANYVEAMKKVDEAKVGKRSEGAKILANAEPDPGIQQFLLTNLKPSSPPTDPQTYRIRLPLDVLSSQISNGDIGGFPYDVGEKQWDGRTMFVKGAKSKYINRKSIEPAKAFFPNYRLETLDAGHWVHAEKPNEFVELVAAFVDDKLPPPSS